MTRLGGGSVRVRHGVSTRVTARPTEVADLEWVVRLEANPENTRFVIPWSRDRHRAALADRSVAHWVFTSIAGAPVGFAILSGVRVGAASVELVRIVIDDKGKGFGRAALETLVEWVFDGLGAHRLWLDVFPENERARRLYESAGFTEEGTLRDAVRVDGGFRSLVVYARLASETRRTPS